MNQIKEKQSEKEINEQDYVLKDENVAKGSIVYHYFKLSQQIKKLGSEHEIKDYKKIRDLAIIAGIFFLLSLLSLLSIEFWSSNLWIRIGIPALFLILSIIVMAYDNYLSGTEYYENQRSIDSDRRSRIVEYMIRYYLVHKEIIEGNKIRTISNIGLNNVLNKLTEECKEKNNIEVDIDYLSEKISSEWKSFEEKIRRSILLLFAVALATAGIATVKEFATTVIRCFYLYDQTEMEKAFVAMIANAIAFVAFGFVVWMIRTFKDSLDNSKATQCRNFEYAYYSLKRIKATTDSTVKTEGTKENAE